MQIKYSEIFTSFQGEAGFAGMPTIWVRFWGCNLSCEGFAQKDPTDFSSYVLPYKTIDLKPYKTLEELPVFDYGCDSSYSWAKKFSHLAHKEDSKTVAQKIIDLGIEKLGLSAPQESLVMYEPYDSFWVHPITGMKVQLCFTGGEPMLWQKQMNSIINELDNLYAKPLQITIETNGTKAPIEFPKIQDIEYHFSVSPKLFNVSGEIEAINPTILNQYFNFNGWLKFVHNGSKEAWDELDEHLKTLYGILPQDWDIWIMPVGATKEQQMGKNIAEISNEAMKRGFKVSTRNHSYVYGNIIGS
jgi:7-carboxy-7-deazaguanine synthase